jgi:hypothetical protein
MPAKNDFASPDKTIHNVPGAIGSATALGINDAGQVVGNIFNGAGNGNRSRGHGFVDTRRTGRSIQ